MKFLHPHLHNMKGKRRQFLIPFSLICKISITIMVVRNVINSFSPCRFGQLDFLLLS